MSRRKVPNVMGGRSKLTQYNIKNDKMSDIKNFYGWTERQLEQNVRAVVGTQADRGTLQKHYQEAYRKKD